jgi:hypothetical protein
MRWKLVPVEPTEEMLSASAAIPCCFTPGREYDAAVYRAMLSAAPAAPEAPSDAWRPTHLHYKGDEYQKLFDALHTETCEQMTIYRSKAGQVYARPKTMFEQRLADGRLRFEPLRPDGQTGGK